MNLFGKDNRSRKIQHNVYITIVCKAIVALITFVQVPLVLGCLGEYQNGVCLTISSLLLWIDIMDVGLGNGLRNRLAEFLAHDKLDDARQVVSSTFAMLALIIIPVSIILCFLIGLCDTNSMLNVDCGIIPNLSEILIVGVAFVCATFIFKFIGNFYMGLQMPAASNVLQALGMTLGLLLTWLLAISNHGTLLNIVMVNTASPLLVYLMAYPYTFCYKHRELAPAVSHINMSAIKDLFGIGSRFFLIQLGALFLFASSNFLISALYSPKEVTPFQIAFRYMNILVTLFTIIVMPLWNATTDAYHRGDWEWIRQADKRMTRISAGFTLLAILMVMASPLFYKLWINGLSNVPLSYTILMGLYTLTIVISMRYSYFLNGIGALQLQVIMTITDAFLFIAGACVAANMTQHLEYFILLMFLTQLPGLLVNMIQFRKILHHKADGIWEIK